MNLRSSSDQADRSKTSLKGVVVRIFTARSSGLGDLGRAVLRGVEDAVFVF